MLLVLRMSPVRTKAGENQASACKVAATTLRCVSTAPLDNPVVPPVYCKKATESNVTGGALSVRAAPSFNTCFSGTMVRSEPSGAFIGNSNAGTILARCRTANVIQRPYHVPSKSPIDTTTTVLTAVWSMTSSSV